ncbi:hypothetical protein CDL15_Pgr022355 [Punica granatum]|uniref:Uncharacterized protein n=1 Tax=Punica granatum TaxID=22663 RepID=A0A218Y3Z8_PUNGR|nr:hypothetical protein CDL15_Pgr022355 [Punica granatum]PKI69337.1 hypothetical protein CRG98_010271 [Punica granatum]
MRPMGSTPRAHLEFLDPLKIEGLRGSSLIPSPGLSSRGLTLYGSRGSTPRAYLEALDPLRFERLKVPNFSPRSSFEEVDPPQLEGLELTLRPLIL